MIVIMLVAGMIAIRAAMVVIMMMVIMVVVIRRQECRLDLENRSRSKALRPSTSLMATPAFTVLCSLA